MTKKRRADGGQITVYAVEADDDLDRGTVGMFLVRRHAAEFARIFVARGHTTKARVRTSRMPIDQVGSLFEAMVRDLISVIESRS